MYISKISVFDILELHNPSRYLREVPISVLPSATQRNTDNDFKHAYHRASTSGTDVPTTEDVNKCKNTSDNNTNPVEFFISSDGSPILEHTTRVIYLEVRHNKDNLRGSNAIKGFKVRKS